ncbi:5-formyltetrahydrofolate cyclo-ligase [Neoroseomonas lacus]|uniref:5-formyltetrahydrofolate cyclo-ligase n=1 Tax=Neoroseomonas lacus TaxID=287609 RepID=A0A917L358_9PROT|nr:5-formyltetrahydrofolate cyclo-ligase [Neoroseomonas lacus]GGJ42114.1 5-formyltetrahydrofolate cyclo-ligase [Neoroseomonas lacus]
MTQRPGIASPEEDPNAEILCASPPCFMHELDPAWLGLLSWEQVRAWRRAERAALIARRVAVPVAERLERDDAITVHLRATVPDLAQRHVGFYWPFKGEYDPRPLARALHHEGTRLALPVVVAKGRPLIFRSWSPGTRMMPGVWNIPIPDEGDEVTPDTLLIPLVGFDAQGYRLGYGGGYYDRTLVSMASRPLAIGVGFESSRLVTIHPQPHDVRMDLTVTEAGATSVSRGTRLKEPAR